MLPFPLAMLQRALGTHRLWASEVLSLLLLPNNPTVDRCVSDLLLLPQLTALALALQCASVLQARVVQVRTLCHASGLGME